MVKLKWPNYKQGLLKTEKAEEKKRLFKRCDTKHHQGSFKSISSTPIDWRSSL